MTLQVRRLPVIQNWSCHQCGNCCREYYVTVTDEEKRRIEGQEWSQRPGFEGRPIFAWYAGPPWRKEYRLEHREDGSCIFLNEQGLCRIHAEFGERAKPLACQLYPYLIVPAGEELRVSVRFSCPSAARNLGRPVTEQAEAIRRYARELVPADAKPIAPPPLGRGQTLQWPDLLRLVELLDELFAGARADLPRRMIQAVRFVRLLEQARVEKLQGSRLSDLWQVLAEAAAAEMPQDLSTLPASTRWARVLFRLIVAQCARKDQSPHLRRGLRGRWKLFRAGLQFASGRGTIPRLQMIFGDVDFGAIEQPFGGLPAEAAEMLERYYRIKISGIQFFGRAFYRVPFIEGFYSLALTLPAILWIARWLAAGAGRDRLTTDDVATALTVVDHQWGFAAAFGFGYARRRVRLLASQGQLEPLIAEYSR